MIGSIRIEFLLLMLLFLRLCATAQPTGPGTPTTGLRAIYRLDYRLDSAVATPKRVHMVLRINNGASCFQSTPKHVYDSVYVSLQGHPEQEQLQKAADASRKPGRNEFAYIVIKQPAKDWVVYQDVLGVETYQYQEKSSLFHWRITPTKQMVAGYECQQAYAAFGGRIWEAWFTRDIPVSEGPYKFYGLPGLIVRVRDTHDNYVLEMISLVNDARPFDIAAKSGAPFSVSQTAPTIKKAKFKQAKHNDDLTVFDRFAASGNIIPKGMQKDYFAKLKRQNNPLELK